MYYIDILIYFRDSGHKINTDSVSGLQPPVEHRWRSPTPNPRPTTGNGGDSRCDQPELNPLCCVPCLCKNIILYFS